jgi:hypothetical protein
MSYFVVRNQMLSWWNQDQWEDVHSRQFYNIVWANVVSQENKDIQIGIEELKPALFPGDLKKISMK